MSKLYPIIAIDHEDGETVYVWGRTHGLEAIRSCVRTHPEEAITIRQITMTEEQFDALEEYDGDC